jgi:hypothetical protein
MTKRQIAKRIWLGFDFYPDGRPTGEYAIHTSQFGGLDAVIVVSKASVGFAIIRALRAEALARPSLFPQSASLSRS